MKFNLITERASRTERGGVGRVFGKDRLTSTPTSKRGLNVSAKNKFARIKQTAPEIVKFDTPQVGIRSHTHSEFQAQSKNQCVRQKRFKYRS